MDSDLYNDSLKNVTWCYDVDRLSIKEYEKHESNNKRVVLFEKHQTYFYLVKQGFCVQECKIQSDLGKRINIGSNACQKCIFNIGFNYRKGFIICRKITEAIKGDEISISQSILRNYE
jgi:hypothetical protein